MRRLKSTFPSLARIRLGDMESWAFKFGAEVFFSCLFMSYSNDLSPPKLVLCEVIRHSYGTNPQDSSESCQELYNLLSPSDLDQLKQVQLNYLHKLYDGWEPDRKEAYLFLLQYQPGSAFINQILTEWENLVQESDEFIPWMVQLQEWRSQYMDEQDESSLLVFVSSVVASFHLIPFSSYYLIADLLCDYLQEKNQVVSFPSPFPLALILRKNNTVHGKMHFNFVYFNNKEPLILILSKLSFFPSLLLRIHYLHLFHSCKMTFRLLTPISYRVSQQLLRSSQFFYRSHFIHLLIDLVR